MKYVVMIVMILTGLQAQAEALGVGIGLGDPTGFTAKYEFRNGRAVDGLLGWPDGRLYLHGDYILDHVGFRLDRASFDFYYGVGGRLRDRKVKDETDTHLGVRFPLGVRHMFKNPRIEAFGELALIMDIVPETDTDLDFTIGARYYF